jgi:hypothetical protein
VSALRDLAVVLPDQDIGAVLTALLGRRHHALGLRALSFDPGQDVIREAAGNDSGCYLRGASLLAPRRKTHRHGLVILDEQWGGSPGRESIEKKVSEELARDWGSDAAVVVISPELENWVFVRSDHLPRALRWPERLGAPRTWLKEHGAWPENLPKPVDPKEALHLCAKQGGVRITPRWFEELAGSPIGLSSCTDPAFCKLVDTLQRWFPAVVVGSSGSASL